MAIRAKARQSTRRRGTPAMAGRVTRTRPTRAERPSARHAKHAPAATVHRKTSTFAPASKASSNGHGNGHAHGIHSYSKALRFLNSLNDFERLRIVRYNTQNFDLDRMRTLLKKLGNPHEQFRSVHIAGTKGKGSTCAMVASMVQAAGYKTGLYTSPHLIDIRERFQINGEMISQAEFVRLVRLIEPIVGRMRPTPTFFDVLTA